MPTERDVETVPPSDVQNPGLYQILIIGLLIVVAIAMVAGFVLAWRDKAVPDNLWAIGLVAVGALAGMLAPRAAK